jgi:hypothetical protein
MIWRTFMQVAKAETRFMDQGLRFLVSCHYFQPLDGLGFAIRWLDSAAAAKSE